MKKLKRFLPAVIVLAAFLLFAILYAGVKFYNGVDDAYAQWGAAEMVIDYMRDHDGKWPPNWESLRGYYEKGGGRVGGWSFAKFQSRVYIDFGADSEVLCKQAAHSNIVPFDVIHATSTWGSQMGDGPNAMLYRYFRQGQTTSQSVSFQRMPGKIPSSFAWETAFGFVIWGCVDDMGNIALLCVEIQPSAAEGLGQALAKLTNDKNVLFVDWCRLVVITGDEDKFQQYFHEKEQH